MTKKEEKNLLEMPFKTGKAGDMERALSDNHLAKISSSRIIWHLLNRHKFGLVTAWAVIVTISYLFPPVWDILGSVVQ